MTVKEEIINQRLIPTPMETRGALARYEEATGEYTVWMTSQAPHVMRLLLTAFVFGIPETKLRCISPNVGGGFGQKIFCYNDMAFTMWAARKLGRPVKFVEDRTENYLYSTHGRDHLTDIEMGATKDGKITALNVKTYANLGGYLSTIAPGIPTTLYGRMMTGVYKIPASYCHVTGVYTNTAMVDAYRGAGRPEATYVIERMSMRPCGGASGWTRPRYGARISSSRVTSPTKPASGMLPYDSGNYEPALDKALQMAGYQNFRKEQEEARKQGKLSWHRPSLLCRDLRRRAVRLDRPAGRGLGRRPVGKRQRPRAPDRQGDGDDRLAAARPGPRDDVRADRGRRAGRAVRRYHDRAFRHAGHAVRLWHLRQPHAWRSAARRSTRAWTRSTKRRNNWPRICWRPAPEDIVYENGKAYVKGSPDQSKTHPGDCAPGGTWPTACPRAWKPFLDEMTYYDPPNCTFPFGTHICVVEVDKDTGRSS